MPMYQPNDCEQYQILLSTPLDVLSQDQQDELQDHLEHCSACVRFREVSGLLCSSLSMLPALDIKPGLPPQLEDLLRIEKLKHCAAIAKKNGDDCRLKHQLASALDYYVQALDLYRRLESRQDEAIVLTEIENIQDSLQNMDAAISMEKEVALYRQTGDANGSRKRTPMIKHKKDSPTPLAQRRALLRAKRRPTSSPHPSHKMRQSPSWTGFRGKTFWDWLHSIITPFALGLCAIIATVNITQQQTAVMERQNTVADEQLKSQISQAYMAFTLEIDKIFIDDPKMRPYFFNGKEINPGQNDYNKAVGIAYYHLDFFDAFIKLTASKAFQQSPESQQVWDNYMQDSFKKSPIMCTVLKKASDDREYELQFIDRFKGNCRKDFG